MKIKEITTLIMLMALSIQCKQRMTVKDGILTMHGEGNCTVNYNDHEFTVDNSGPVEGLFYGLVEYRCGIEKGKLISEVKCKQCGLFCNHNEYINGCESRFFTMLIGTLIGIIISLLSYLLLRKPANKGIDWIIKQINYIKMRKQDKKEEKRVKRLKERTDTQVRYKFKPLTSMTIKGERKTYARRELLVNGGNKHKSAGVTTICLAMCMIGCGLACDNTLFVKSDGKVCDSTRCVDSSMYSIPLSTGVVVCFKDFSGEIMKLTIDHSVIKAQYNLIYYTSNYTIRAAEFYRCKGAGGCWENLCTPTSKHVELEDKLVSPVSQYGCQSGTLGCDTWCAYKTACTWYKWSLITDGEMIPVYEKIRDFWEVTIKIKYHNTTMKHRLNVNNPRINLDGIMHGIPIYITGVESEDIYETNGLIVYKNNAYIVKVSGINMPETDIIGDYQMATEGGTHTYNVHTVTCAVESCKVYCRAPESKLARVIRTIHRYPQVPYIMQDSMFMLETSRPIDVLANVLIGNVNLKNLHVEKAQCKVEQVGTYSCTGCTTDPYAILQAHDIKSEGILPFESNCSFTKDYISCSPEPYKLVLSKFKRNCYLFVPSLNTTIYLDFQFTFKGALDPSKPIYNVESDMALLKGIMTNESFITSLISTFSFFGIASIGLSVLMRIIRALEIRRLNAQMIRIDEVGK